MLTWFVLLVRIIIAACLSDATTVSYFLVTTMNIHIQLWTWIAESRFSRLVHVTSRLQITKCSRMNCLIQVGHLICKRVTFEEACPHFVLMYTKNWNMQKKLWAKVDEQWNSCLRVASAENWLLLPSGITKEEWLDSLKESVQTACQLSLSRGQGDSSSSLSYSGVPQAPIGSVLRQGMSVKKHHECADWSTGSSYCWNCKRLCGAKEVIDVGANQILRGNSRTDGDDGEGEATIYNSGSLQAGENVHRPDVPRTLRDDLLLKQYEDIKSKYLAAFYQSLRQCKLTFKVQESKYRKQCQM